MSKLVRGDQLPSNLRREVLARFVYRWTSDNPQREQAWHNIAGGTPKTPLVSDAQWLREHAFYVTDRGALDKRKKGAEPAYMAETAREHHATKKSPSADVQTTKKSPAQLQREIDEVLTGSPGHRAHSSKLKAREYKKLATATSIPGIEKYINEFAYSTNYRVDPDTLQITNPVKAPPENWFVMPHRGGFLFGRKH